MNENLKNQNNWTEETNQPDFAFASQIEEIEVSPKGKRLFARAVSILVIIALLATAAYSAVDISNFKIYKNENGITISVGENKKNTDKKSETEQSLIKINSVKTTDKLVAGVSPMDVPDIVDKAKPSVVGIVGEQISYFGEGNATGSGIIMSEDGYILTNNHVIDGMDKLYVVLDNGEKYDAKLIGGDDIADIAVLKINKKGLKKAEFGDSNKLRVGETAIAIGNPLGLELQGTTTKGIISAINRDITLSDNRVMTLIQTDASINPGNSGGPLLNQYGQVIGITTLKIVQTNTESLGFAIPMNSAKPIIDDLIKYGKVRGRPAIGISGRIITEQIANYYNLPAGLLVDSVDKKSDAYKKGLSEKDIIKKVNGKKVTGMETINEAKKGLKVGDTLSFEIDRNGKELCLP